MTLTDLIASHAASRTWQRDTTVFAPADAPADVQHSIQTRLGWLDAPSGMHAHDQELADFVRQARRDGLTDVYLLGMGGSSLCAEVLREVPVARTDGARLTVIDTTDERTIRGITDALAPGKSLFIVSSKSGGTIEPNSLEHHFWSVVADAMKTNVGRHFAAITDPDTSLVALAAKRGYRHTFVNDPNIGGRYSALSLCGLVPAALLGIDVGALLQSGAAMAERCKVDSADNPGLALGAFIGTSAVAGRDKLTVLLPDPLASFGAWIEQLIAESTGKHGRGALPIVGEPLGKASEYLGDRAFVVVTTPNTPEPALAKQLEQVGHPVFRIATTIDTLGGDFFRWEFATAIAGAVIGINPFDEPNVTDAKNRTKAQLDARKASGTFRLDPPLEKGPGYSRREHERSAPVTGGAYLAILDYLPAEARRASVIAQMRGTLRRRAGTATTYGMGPRYLHSTGQYHKGGPNTGTFLIFTAADQHATPVPETDYTFSALKYAQALGDFDALAAGDRHVIHYHFDDPAADYTSALEKVLLAMK